MTPNPLLQIEDLHVQRDEKEILHGLNLTVDEGQVHAVMGPNGSGKSTLANTLMGNPSCEITAGRIRFKGEDIAEWEVDERARAGIFLAFQYPVEIPGVPLVTFLREAINAVRGDKGPIGVREFRLRMLEKMDLLSVDSSFATRYLNDGFSGGEKKRCEILQMAMLEPALPRASIPCGQPISEFSLSPTIRESCATSGPISCMSSSTGTSSPKAGPNWPKRWSATDTSNSHRKRFKRWPPKT